MPARTALEILTAARRKAKTEKLTNDFLLMWRASGGPRLEAEHRFCAGRKWRFDFAVPEKRLAIDLEGGIWTGGSHTRGGRFNSDAEKYNAAALLGWKVVRFTVNMITRAQIEPVIEMLKK